MGQWERSRQAAPPPPAAQEEDTPEEKNNKEAYLKQPTSLPWNSLTQSQQKMVKEKGKFAINYINEELKEAFDWDAMDRETTHQYQGVMRDLQRRLQALDNKDANGGFGESKK